MWVQSSLFGWCQQTILFCDQYSYYQNSRGAWESSSSNGRPARHLSLLQTLGILRIGKQNLGVSLFIHVLIYTSFWRTVPSFVRTKEQHFISKSSREGGNRGRGHRLQWPSSSASFLFRLWLLLLFVANSIYLNVCVFLEGKQHRRHWEKPNPRTTW